MLPFKKIGCYSLLLSGLFLLLSSCSKKSDTKDVAPHEVDYSKYPWIASLVSSQDTIQIKNNELYVTIAPRDFSNPNLTVSALNRFKTVTGDFELSTDYEKVTNFFLLVHNDDKDKNATITVSNVSSAVTWGESYELESSNDLENSTSGTLTVKRTGQTLKVTIVKNYISGSVPAQKTHEVSCANFFDGKTYFTFSGISFNTIPASLTMKRFSLTDNSGQTIIDNFSHSDSLYVDRQY